MDLELKHDDNRLNSLTNSDIINHKMRASNASLMKIMYSNLIIEKYTDLLASTNLQGKYQKIQFIITLLLAFTCSMTVLIIPLQKILPVYYCVIQKNQEKEFAMYKSDSKRF